MSGKVGYRFSDKNMRQRNDGGTSWRGAVSHKDRESGSTPGAATNAPAAQWQSAALWTRRPWFNSTRGYMGVRQRQSPGLQNPGVQVRILPPVPACWTFSTGPHPEEAAPLGVAVSKDGRGQRHRVWPSFETRSYDRPRGPLTR